MRVATRTVRSQTAEFTLRGKRSRESTSRPIYSGPLRNNRHRMPTFQDKSPGTWRKPLNLIFLELPICRKTLTRIGHRN